MDREFEEKVELLRNSYLLKPRNTLVELEKTLQKLGMLTKEDASKKSFDKKHILDDIDKDLLLTVILVVLIGLMGLFQIDSIPLYLFGLAFFIAGLFIGLKNKGFGLIFLASHGLTGLGLMIGSLLHKVVSSPLFTDLSFKLYIYFGIMIIIGIIALIIVILSNLSDSMKKLKYIPNVVLFLFLLVFIMAGIMSYIMPYLF